MTTNENPILSLIVVSWNSWKDLSKCLASIYSSDLQDLETIVVDNASVDKTVAAVEEQYPQVILKKNTENVGHTLGVNQGLRSARGEYIMILDADTEFPSTMLSGMLAYLKANPDVSLTTPRTLNTDGTVQENARNLPSVMSGLFGRQSTLTEWFPNNPFSRRYLMRDRISETEPFEVEQISASCMFFHKNLLDEVGLWDETYPGYWVDTDWCAHIISLKKKITCVPEFEITHHENNAKGKRKSPRRLWLFHYGAYILYRKWYSWGVLDPRSIIAGLLLGGRALVLVLLNYWKPADDSCPEYVEQASTDES